jgi:hypothetical protein
VGMLSDNGHNSLPGAKGQTLPTGGA